MGWCVVQKSPRFPQKGRICPDNLATWHDAHTPVPVLLAVLGWISIMGCAAHAHTRLHNVPTRPAVDGIDADPSAAPWDGSSVSRKTLALVRKIFLVKRHG